MSNPPLKARFRFQTKVLLPVVAVMVLLMAATMWLVNRRFNEQIRTEAGQQLNIFNDVFRDSEISQTKNLLARYRTIINEPRFIAVMNTAEPEARTVNRFLGDFINQAEEDTKVIVLTREDGRRFAEASRDPGLNVSEFERDSAAVIRQALAGQPLVLTALIKGKLYDVVSIPLQSSALQGGVLTFGVEIGDNVVREVKKLPYSEVLFVANNQAVASSIANTARLPKLVAQFRTLSATPEVDGQEPVGEIALNGEHFLCQAGLFPTSSDGRLGYLLLSSYEHPLQVLRATQRSVFLVGFIGIVLGTTFVWLLIRKSTEPLRQLRDSAEAVGLGDFSRRVEVTSRDECGELAAVFNRMTENLKTSHEELERTVETLKSTQNQLIQSEKLSGIGEFVAGVAHELNNPLTSVMGFAELLQQAELPESQRRFLDMIFKSAKRCQKIVQSLLSFARRHAPERKVICVNEIVESAVEILQYQMRTNNIEVFTRLDPNLPPTLVDSHQMQQVFLNIINNARQAIEGNQPRGWLRITTQAVEGQVRITFQDNGPGIAPENLKRIFNPFFTTKEVGKGTGLGLSLCYGIVSEHGGSVTPYSKLGEGATFVIELPITREESAKVEKTAAVAPLQNPGEGVGRRVLVVDDEDSILQMIQAALTANGYKVDVARDGETALRRMSQYHYDLALCDWKMPGLSGQQVYERLHAFNPEMSKRLIFITGDVANEKTQEFLKASNKVCLPKPFTLADFRAAIGRILSPLA